jgi:hypothetical protein
MNWRIIVDKRIQIKFSDFYETKNGMVEPTYQLFQRWKDAGKEVRFLQMDNAGEKKSLQQRFKSADWKSLKLTQPLMLQSFSDEFELPDGPIPNTPATPGDVLVRAKPEDCVSQAEQFKYRSGTGKLLHR